MSRLFNVIKSKVTETTDKILNRGYINPFGESIYDNTDSRYFKRERFEDMVVALEILAEGQSQNKMIFNPAFITATSLLSSLRDLLQFETILKETPFGLMLEVEHVESLSISDLEGMSSLIPKKKADQGEYVKRAITLIHGLLTDLIYKNDEFDYEEAKHCFNLYNFDLIYTGQHDHAVLVIPYLHTSSEEDIARMIIHSPDFIESRLMQ